MTFHDDVFITIKRRLLFCNILNLHYLCSQISSFTAAEAIVKASVRLPLLNAIK